MVHREAGRLGLHGLPLAARVYPLFSGYTPLFSGTVGLSLTVILIFGAAAARVRGSGAGMEPLPGSVLRHGVWHYRPEPRPLPKLALAVSPYTADYTLCWHGRCKMLTQLVPAPSPGVIELFPCRAGAR